MQNMNGPKQTTHVNVVPASVHFTLIYRGKFKTAFFNKLDFKVINKELLPHKIWGDCIKCVKFPNCDENAVIIAIEKRQGEDA